MTPNTSPIILSTRKRKNALVAKSSWARTPNVSVIVPIIARQPREPGRPLRRHFHREPQLWHPILPGRLLQRLLRRESQDPGEQVLDRKSAKSFLYNETDPEKEEPT